MWCGGRDHIMQVFCEPGGQSLRATCRRLQSQRSGGSIPLQPFALTCRSARQIAAAARCAQSARSLPRAVAWWLRLRGAGLVGSVILTQHCDAFGNCYALNHHHHRLHLSTRSKGSYEPSSPALAGVLPLMERGEPRLSHNALRGSGPGQKPAFKNALAHVGCPDRRVRPALHDVLFALPAFTSRRVSDAISLTQQSATGSR